MFILFAWCAVLFGYGLDAGPLYRTESLRAIIGAECLRGHWLYPVLYGEPFLTKPPGQYAAIAICSLPFGEVSAASARIPSAFSATAAVFLMWGLFRRSFSDRSALLAALLLPTSVLWLDKAPSAEIDMSLLGWVTVALVAMYRALNAQGPPPLGFLLLAHLALVAGTLTKWTAPAFFYLTLVPLLAWRRQLGVLFTWRHLLAFALAAGLLALWALAVAQQVGWEVLRDTIRSEAEYRFNPPPKAKGYPWAELATYPLLVLAAHLPLSLFALRTLRPNFLRSLDEPSKSLVQFLHCWAWPNLVFWALVPNHNVRYALPLSPALMGLGVIGLFALHSAVSASQLTKFAVAFLAFWLVVKIAFVEVVVPQRTAGRNAAATAAQLRERIPASEPLHLLKLKDEGVLFYYARPARRVGAFADIPRPGFAVLLEREWQAAAATGDAELVHWMYDQQGDPLILAKFK